MNPEVAKAGMDIAAVSTLLGWFAGFLPALATALTIVWTAIRIYETDTVQKWLKAK